MTVFDCWIASGAMPPLNLAFLNKVRVSFCPFFNVAACRCSPPPVLPARAAFDSCFVGPLPSLVTPYVIKWIGGAHCAVWLAPLQPWVRTGCVETSVHTHDRFGWIDLQLHGTLSVPLSSVITASYRAL